MTDQTIHAVPDNLTPMRSDDAEYAGGVVPFIAQRPTVRALTDCPITRGELKHLLETIKRTNRMVESAFEKLIAG